MKYYRNQIDGRILLYPETWLDVGRCFVVRFLLPSFKKTWPGNKYWWRKSVHTIEAKTTETMYPHLASKG